MPTLRTRQNQATAAKDRLQPALLDRLTDHEPHMRTERPDAVFVNESRLREALLRDLGWLLNARDAWDHVEMEGLEHVQRSAINYGMPPLAGQLLSALDWSHVERSIRESTLQFEIRCQFWSMPYPLELLLKTSLDLETGQVSLQNLRA
jgi:type VI secretion system protein ImpF